MGGPSADTRSDIYRVDRQKVILLFLAGQALTERPRTRYELSHDVIRDGDELRLVMYGEHVVATRNLSTGAITIDHCGWRTKESQKVIEPILVHFFGYVLTLLVKGRGRGRNRDREPVWRIVGPKVDVSIEFDDAVTFTPVAPSVWDVAYNGEFRRFNLAARASA
jgi:hypothetical protein